MKLDFLKNIQFGDLRGLLRTNRELTGLLGLLLVFLVLLGTNATIVNTDTGVDKEYLEDAGELRVLSQRIAKNAIEAVEGKAEAYELLATARDAFAGHWDDLVLGNVGEGVPAAPLSMHGDMSSLQDVWDRVQLNSDAIIVGQETVLSLYEISNTISENIPEIQDVYTDVVEILIANNVPASQVAVAQRQQWLAERIARNISIVLEGAQESIIAAESFQRDASLFGRILNGMLNGDPAMGIEKVTDEEAIGGLQDAEYLFGEFSGSVDIILDTAPELFHIRLAADEIFVDSQELLVESTALSTRFADLVNDRFISPITGYLFGLAVIATIIAIGFLLYQETRARLSTTADRNEENQNAILRLLDELADLADGDLTVSATVTEDFTGAIADSINFAIDQLRSLVGTINLTAVQVSSAAQETQATAMHLAEASEHQAQEIAGASAAVNEMAVSIDQVSANAAESAAVAERSVDIANNGNLIVQNTIEGMDNIREQIQETSKRIKRLGESSQEIGDIVSLINDIADQTNILALNAAIQASMAGDAGRGFAVVADEVQRLAERSSAATKQIEALVKTIQTDTNEAVISMETTTSEVVRGARLAQDAGVALEEIENVSRSLADLIQNISNAARQQASSAGHISNTMNVIQEITSQTSSGTSATAKSIGTLAQMASEMRESVAGFTLPDAA